MTYTFSSLRSFKSLFKADNPPASQSFEQAWPQNFQSPHSDPFADDGGFLIPDDASEFDAVSRYSRRYSFSSVTLTIPEPLYTGPAKTIYHDFENSNGNAPRRQEKVFQIDLKSQVDLASQQPKSTNASVYEFDAVTEKKKEGYSQLMSAKRNPSPPVKREIPTSPTTPTVEEMPKSRMVQRSFSYGTPFSITSRTHGHIQADIWSSRGRVGRTQ
ncbi:hypothetical protein B0J14DRAFT_593052 [Halenospora varia]|nr:hypothetical protein B0J14DRAFT_593052 [Halenospora varia]